MALKSVAPVLLSAKAAAASCFNGSAKVDMTSSEDMQRLSKFEIEGDVPQAVGVMGGGDANYKLRSLELQFLQHFGTIMKRASTLQLHRLSHSERQDRRITEDRVQEIGKLRKLLRTLENFLGAARRKNYTLFPTSSSVQQVSLGPVIALDGLDQTMKDVGLLADTVVSEWVKDMDELQGVADSYVVPVTLAAKTDLLQPPQAELLKLLCAEGRVTFAECSLGWVKTSPPLEMYNIL